MATKRKGTKGNDGLPDWSLSEQQHTAVDLIISGRNLQETADMVGVARATVSQWKNHDPGFQAALNKRRQEAWGEMIDGLRALVPEAVAVLREALLNGPERLAASVYILRS
jgi:predicted transcriptional regulator